MPLNIRHYLNQIYILKKCLMLKILRMPIVSKHKYRHINQVIHHLCHLCHLSH